MSHLTVDSGKLQFQKASDHFLVKVFAKFTIHLQIQGQRQRNKQTNKKNRFELFAKVVHQSVLVGFHRYTRLHNLEMVQIYAFLKSKRSSQKIVPTHTTM